jgi:predicted ribosome quality control (RQC) complex YloA/Tae2 family protein
LGLGTFSVNEQTLKKICAELEAALTGQKFGKIFSLTRFQMAIDFRLRDSKYLFVSIEPTAPRIYLIKRRLRDLEKESRNPHPFFQLLRKKLSNAVLEKVEKLENERIVRFDFLAQDELGEIGNYALIVQLTGRSANLFLLDKNDFILDAARENFGEGQEIGNRYSSPKRVGELGSWGIGESFPQGDFESLSETLDSFYLEKEAEKAFQAKIFH